jgi:hypothetical protein
VRRIQAFLGHTIARNGDWSDAVTKCRIVCRVHLEPVWLDLPYNWVRSGWCGAGARPCNVEVLEGKS